MSKVAQSAMAFGIYVIVTGLGFLGSPEMLLSTLQLPPMPLGWARVVGLLALVIGSYYVICARAENIPFIRATVFVRFGFALGTVLLVLTGQMPAPLMLLGAVDAAGAVWTAMLLNPSRHHRSHKSS